MKFATKKVLIAFESDASFSFRNCSTTQADKNLEKRVYILQSGTAIVIHSRSKK